MIDWSKDGKEDMLVLTDVFSKFSQAFLSKSQKALTLAKILVDKWFYVYTILPWICYNKSCNWEWHLEQLYVMYNIKQPTTHLTILKVNLSVGDSIIHWMGY